jgi:GT2 family glycosyltransferase
MLPKVAVITVSYNAAAFIDEVVLSCQQVDYPKDKLEIIVVDCASSDGTPDKLREKKGITFFPSDKNLGFAGGNNLAIHHAVLEGCEYVYLLNHDAKFDSQALKEAVALAEKDKTIGSVQSRMMLWQDPEQLNATGGEIHFLGFGFVRDNGRPWENVKDEVTDGEEIAYASGAAVLLRSSALRKVGVLDPFLFLYHEDLDLGWRLRLAGYKNVLSTKSIVFHHYEFSRSIKKFFWMERNRWLVHLSHLRWATLALLLPFMLALELALIVFAIKGGWIKEKILVYVDLLRPSTWKHIRKKRLETFILRKVSDKEILRRFTGKIDHQETSSPLVEKFANPLLNLSFQVIKRIIRW